MNLPTHLPIEFLTPEFRGYILAYVRIFKNDCFLRLSKTLTLKKNIKIRKKPLSFFDGVVYGFALITIIMSVLFFSLDFKITHGNDSTTVQSEKKLKNGVLKPLVCKTSVEKCQQTNNEIEI